MMPRLPWVLFSLSLALNLLFLGGAYWASQKPVLRPGPADQLEWAADRLGLTPGQKDALDGFARNTHDRFAQLRHLNEPLIRRAIEETAKPQLDRFALDRLLGAISANYLRFQGTASLELHDFLAALSPEQRAAAVSVLKERREHPPPSLLRDLLPLSPS